MFSLLVAALTGPGLTSYHYVISNGNRTEWSPIRSVIIQVITKSRSSDLFITSTDQIGRHKVLLPINHKNSQFPRKEE